MKVIPAIGLFLFCTGTLLIAGERQKSRMIDVAPQHQIINRVENIVPAVLPDTQYVYIGDLSLRSDGTYAGM